MAGLAQRILTAVSDPIRVEELSVQIGTSIGIAIAPEHGNDVTTLMGRADVAMYVAKEAQSGWQFYREEDDTNSARRLGLLADLRKAIEAGELDVWYQPKVSAETEEVKGVEALARWQHERLGFVPPDEFISIAEGAGLMRDLTHAVIDRALTDARHWIDIGTPIPVAINLSARNLMDDTLPARVSEAAMLKGIDPPLISFEVTETAIMHDRTRVAALLHELRERGFRLAIDDYGTGYSSLAYLRELPVDVLKIDRAFIENLDFNDHNRIIVQSTIDLGHNLELELIAEGVERQAEYEVLRDLGCDYLQGYLFSRPLPVDQLDHWLETRRSAEPALPGSTD